MNSIVTLFSKLMNNKRLPSTSIMNDKSSPVSVLTVAKDHHLDVVHDIGDDTGHVL